MKAVIVDRIENKKNEKSNRLFLFLAIASVPLAIANIATTPELFQNSWEVIDFLVFLFPVFLFLYYRRRLKKWGGQFIEWNKTGILYKARETSTTEIKYESIEDLSINLETIVFKLKDGSDKTLLIEDYLEYEDRIRIKGNFEKMKNNA